MEAYLWGRRRLFRSILAHRSHFNKPPPRGNQRAARERGERAAQKVETHPTNTLASANESSMNFRGSQLPREAPTPCEVRRILLLRGWVNKGKRKAQVPQLDPER